MKTRTAVPARRPPGTPRRPVVSLVLAIACAAAAATPALAHQFWLSPSRYDPSRGQVVEVGAVAGTGFRGERKPWSPPNARRLVARAAKTIDVAGAATIGQDAWIRFAPSDAGGALLAYESAFTPIALPAAAFDAYLADEGLDAPLAARRHAPPGVPGRERYRRCAKLWLAGGDAARATAPLGLPLEIVPLALPGAAASLRVRVLWNGRPLPGALLKTWRAELAPGGAPAEVATRDSIAVAWQGRTGADGEVTLPCARPGEWLASVTTMVPSADRAEADWESTWASLTFLRPDGPGRSR